MTPHSGWNVLLWPVRTEPRLSALLLVGSTAEGEVEVIVLRAENKIVPAAL